MVQPIEIRETRMPMPSCARMAAVLLAAAMCLSAVGAQAETHDPLYLHQIGQVTGLSINPDEPETFLIATPFGVLSVANDGVTKHLAPDVGMLTELVRHRQRPSVLMASGYRSKEKKLGIVQSRDGGRTWEHLADGAGGPVAFRAIALSHGNPTIVYGFGDNLQVSEDGGLSWSIAHDAPGQVFDLAVSTRSSGTLFLATMDGLLLSEDSGRSWRPAYPVKQPATMVHVTGNGIVHAFVYGVGLVTSPDIEHLKWEIIADDFGNRVFLDMATDSGRPDKVIAVVDTGAVMISHDGGRRWRSFEGQSRWTNSRIAAGHALYQENCQACHGVDGVGENPDDPMAVDQDGLPLAPALDDSAHAWHHSDADLVRAILDGISRNPRMAAWRDHGISRDEAESLVTYIKSLWSFQSLACQGARHMSCMH